MTTIAETLQALKEEFASLPDGFARYAYLTELSALLAPPTEVRRAEYSYRGCQSQVWLCAGQMPACAAWRRTAIP